MKPKRNNFFSEQYINTKTKGDKTTEAKAPPEALLNQQNSRVLRAISNVKPNDINKVKKRLRDLLSNEGS